MKEKNPDFLGGNDASHDPIVITQAWLAAAKEVGDIETDAVHLASVDDDRIPNLRVVYARGYTESGVVFYSHYNGRKGRELDNGYAAINYYFPKWQRQIRMRGRVRHADAQISDTYFLSRAEGSRLGAWMSRQSEPVADRETMEGELAAIAPERANQRPQTWGGFILEPTEIEFWAMGAFRIHDRFQWLKEGEKWHVQRLYP